MIISTSTKPHFKESVQRSTAMSEYLVIGFFVVSAGFASALRARRIQLRRSYKASQTIPLDGQLNRIIIHKHNDSTWYVKNYNNVKVLEIIKAGDSWHLQLLNRKVLATIKNGWINKYIVLHRHDPIPESPLRTTPSVLRMDSRLDEFFTDFRYGTNMTLRWNGLSYFELITKNQNGQRDSGIDFHKRVAVVAENDDRSGYTIHFDFEKINIEILLSTFTMAAITGWNTLQYV